MIVSINNIKIKFAILKLHNKIITMNSNLEQKLYKLKIINSLEIY